jgi:hypothetical protein
MGKSLPGSGKYGILDVRLHMRACLLVFNMRIYGFSRLGFKFPLGA